jgi:PTS system N-acetylglucosamine-specific IIC component
VVYYFLLRWVITKWNLRTPGREDDDDDVTDVNNVLLDRPGTDAEVAAHRTGPVRE